MYDPRLLKINFYELFNHNLDSFFHDDILINALYEKEYYFLIDKCPYDDKNTLKIKVLENYFLYLSSKNTLTKKETTYLNFLHDFYFNMFRLNPTLFYKSSIYTYKKVIFPSLDIPPLEQTSKNIKKYLNGKLTNPLEITFLLLSFKDEPNIDSNIKNQILSYIIANYKNSTSFEKIFLLETINKEINPQNASLITINKSLLDEDIFTSIYELLTEIKHTNDLMIPQSRKFSTHSFSLLNIFLSESDNEEYDIETKKYVLDKLNTIFSKYGSDKYLTITSKEIKKLPKKLPLKRVSKPYENIVISIQNNPKLLNEYPQLKLVFNSDGSLKSINELTKLYQLLSTNLEEISKKTPIEDLTPIIDFIEYNLLSRTPVLLINQNKDYLYTFFDIISYLINRRCDEIDYLLKQIINNPHQKEEISKLIEKHFIIIDEYLKYLSFYRLNLNKDTYIETGFISLEVIIIKTKDNYNFIMKSSPLKLLTLK